MSELNFFDLETSKPKMRVKRDALPVEWVSHPTALPHENAPPIPDELPEPEQDFDSDYENDLDVQDPDDLSSDEEAEDEQEQDFDSDYEEPDVQNPDDLSSDEEVETISSELESPEIYQPQLEDLELLQHEELGNIQYEELESIQHEELGSMQQGAPEPELAESEQLARVRQELAEMRQELAESEQLARNEQGLLEARQELARNEQELARVRQELADLHSQIESDSELEESIGEESEAEVYKPAKITTRRTEVLEESSRGEEGEQDYDSGYDDVLDTQDPDALDDDLQDLEDQESAAGEMDAEPKVRCKRGEGSMCSNDKIKGESEEIESEFQSEEMEGEFQEAEAAMEEAGSVTTEIEASAMKITTELETEGVMLEEEAAAGPPGWIADAVTFVVFSCQIYDIIKGIRSKTALQKEKTDKMIDEVNKAYIKINDKINLYEKEKVKIDQEIQLLKSQNDKLDEIDTLEKSELKVQRLEKELSKIVNEQGNLITKLDLMLKKEAKLQDRIQGIGQHMEGAEAAISKIIEKVKVVVEDLYDYDPLVKIQAEVLADVCECTNGVINFVIEEGKALKRAVIRELEYYPPTTLDKEIQATTLYKKVQNLFHSIENIKEGIDKSVSQFVDKNIVEPIEKFVEPATQWAAKNILKPLEALSKEIIISHQSVKDLQQNFARMNDQIKEGHEIIDRVEGLIGEEHRIQEELTEEKATILQHEKVALWIEKHPEIQREIQKQIIPKFSCYKPTPKEILGYGERQPDVLDPTCNPCAKFWFYQNPSAREVWLKHYPDDSKTLAEMPYTPENVALCVEMSIV